MTYTLILGNQAYSSWSLRGWLLLRAFDIDFELRVIPLYTEEYEQFHRDNYPALTVPTLRVQRGSGVDVIWDSLAIAEFLHEQHPDAGLWPDDFGQRAAARSLCAEMHSGFAALRGTMPVNVRRQYKRFEPSAEARQDIERIELLWDWARSKGSETGPYLFGETFCAVDAFFAPVASRFRTYGIALNEFSQAYTDALLAHPATVEFYQAGQKETWVMPHNEFDIE